jgi:glycosyltransferase involved in cell wall biosynthesis
MNEEPTDATKANAPLVSVVTVVINDAHGLQETIDSVRSQTYPNIEHIVVDGGSTDGTVEYLENLEGDVRWLSEPDDGIADAMNKGAAMAAGEWINFMNAGDIFVDGNTVERFLHERDPEAELIYGDQIIRYDTCSVYAQARSLWTVCFSMPFGHQALFARTALLRSYPFRTHYRIVADVDFVYEHYLQGKRFHHLHFPVTVYRYGGVSTQWLPRNCAEVLRMSWSKRRNPLIPLILLCKVMAWLPVYAAKICLPRRISDQLLALRHRIHSMVSSAS